MTAVSSAVENESGIMMVFQGAMGGLLTLVVGAQPTELHRRAWAELADLLETSERHREMAKESSLRAQKTLRVPRTVREFVSALESSWLGGPSPVVSERITDFRALSRGEPAALSSAQGLMTAYTYLRNITREEARRVRS